MYFNHAFQKSFLPVTGNVTLRTTGTTADLTAGELGFFDAITSAAQASGTGTPFILAQGSWFKNTSDKIGPFHGGYQESVKSKMINPKYITRLIKVEAQAPQNQIKEICVCNLKCDHTYRLRLDLKGSPALRFLSHNIYRTLDAYTGCCADPDVETIVDPTSVVILWAKQIVNNPILSQYLKVTVKDWDGGTVATQASTSAADIATFVAALDAYVTTFDPTSATASTDQACLDLEVAYVETKFGTCTFTPTDKYDLEPLRVFAAMVDETGDPCNVQCITVSGQVNPHTGVLTPPVQEPLQAQGVGETVLRDMILTGRYRQEAYPDSMRVESLRMREIEQNPGLANINRSAFYDQVIILHSVPRFNNPTGTFDNDQYMLKIWVDQGADTTAITNFITAACTAANNVIPVNAAGGTFELY